MRNIVREPAGTTTRRRPFAALALATVMALLVAGCAAPQTGPAGSTAAATSPAPSAAAAQPVAAPAPPARGTPAPPMSTPLPAERAANPPPAGPTARLDVSCKTNADCVVKDVGNCCGYYPRCVNVNAAVDPKAVQAQCARNGMASVCGFKPVEGCECVKGECQDKMMLLEGR